MTEGWTLDQLVARVADALAADGVRAPNGRVREVPDARALRWYATIGLLDRPAAFRGRTALYGPRHLLQAVAVKRRQAEGMALAQIQAELSGATEAMLRRVARLPAGLLADGPPAVAGGRAVGNRVVDAASTGGASTGGASTAGASTGGVDSPASSGPPAASAVLADVRSPRSPFWRTRPASASGAGPGEAEPVHTELVRGEPVVAGPVDAEPVDVRLVDAGLVQAGLVQAEPVQAELVQAEPDPARAVRAAAVEPRHLIRLGPGATLVLTTAPSAADVADLHAAAAPLIRLLADRALLTAEEPLQ